MHVCTCVAYMPWLGFGSQRTTGRYQVPLATLKILGSNSEHQPPCKKSHPLSHAAGPGNSVSALEVLPYWFLQYLCHAFPASCFIGTVNSQAFSITLSFFHSQSSLKCHRSIQMIIETEWKHTTISKLCIKEIPREHLWLMLWEMPERSAEHNWDNNCLLRQKRAGLFLSLYGCLLLYSKMNKSPKWHSGRHKCDLLHQLQE